MKSLLLSLCCFLWLGTIHAQNMILPLYPEGVPCGNDLSEEIEENARIGRIIRKVHDPEITVYLPARSVANGTGVVICPGGGYTVLAWDWEGTKMAEWFNSIGIAAFVLKYRLPAWETEECRSEVALMDAQRAMRLVRSKAPDFGLMPNRIGVMGFSAGGHLASTLATHFDMGKADAPLAVERFSSRPDFAILMYPVVSFDTTVAHSGSRSNLLGKNTSLEEEIYYSNEKQVSDQTPPTILIHADDDSGVLPENSVAFYLALRKHKVPAAMHIFTQGGHGFSFAEGKGAVEMWPAVCEAWLTERGLRSKGLRVLLIEGQNNHKEWEQTSQLMRRYLEETGIFQVDIVRTPAQGADMGSFQPRFANYDLLVSNYNGDPWPASTQAAFEAFIRNGGGFVAVHAANNSFPQWPAYNEMIGIGGWYGRSTASGPSVYVDAENKVVKDPADGPAGHHGKRHEYVIDIREPQHPITRGMPLHWLHTEDELYDNLRGPAHNLNVLASAYSDPATGGSGRHEPMLMTIYYGHGRIFHMTLGHDLTAQHCAGFASCLQRGAEWVATGNVSQPLPAEFPTADKTVIHK